MVLKVLFTPASEGIDISGPLIYFTIPTPIQPLTVTESQINSVAVILTVLWLCIFLTRGLKTRPDSKRQIIAEWIVEKSEALVKNNMGTFFSHFPPFIAAIMALSAFSSLLSLFGLFPPTSDLNIVGGWAILVFILITHYKMKCGPWEYAKSFASPVALTPLNVISEIATPVSMAFRHYGNVLSGSVVSVLVGTALQGLSSALFSWLPGALSDIPFLRVGIPAVLSVYFDLFSGCLQAFIFAMLTMLYIANGFPEELYFKRRGKKLAKNQ
ncbi:MAG: F0F1 ATP synthase subunit A [Clostridia bacterium]|nr:F0F1 ATP synthase subunit A [Clostridia bacterium]